MHRQEVRLRRIVRTMQRIRLSGMYYVLCTYGMDGMDGLGGSLNSEHEGDRQFWYVGINQDTRSDPRLWDGRHPNLRICA